MSLLTIRDLTISHNKQNILNNINLKLNTAEIIGIAGGSGSGKTRFFVKPNIMQMHSSYVVTDPKGSARRSSLKRTGTSQLNHCLL